MTSTRTSILACMILAVLAFHANSHAAETKPAAADEKKIVPEFSKGVGPGWIDVTGKDFLNVNCWDDTWVWKDGHGFCTGRPTGVIRYKEPLTNFEFSCEWMHKEKGGNSGIFVWATPDSILSLAKGKGALPHGIEVQVLDLGYKEIYEAQYKQPGNWFTSHGDVFPVGPVKMKPFPPVAPDGQRSFPSKEKSLGINNWNHYYIRAMDGEVKLWVNGEQVSGGNGISPAFGFLCLESEGAPVEFKNLRLRKHAPMETKFAKEYDIPVPVIINPSNRPAVKLDGHALLGTWEYLGTYTREFLPDGRCILRDKDKVVWTKKCVEKTATTVTLEGGFDHKLEGDVLKIEGRYEAKRRK